MNKTLSYIMGGGTISKHFVGAESYRGVPHTFTMSIRMEDGKIKASIADHLMKQSYNVSMTASQLETYITLHCE